MHHQPDIDDAAALLVERAVATHKQQKWEEQSEKAAVKATIAENRIEHMQKGMCGPTTGGSWYEMPELTRHFDEYFAENQLWREEMLATVKEN